MKTEPDSSFSPDAVIICQSSAVIEAASADALPKEIMFAPAGIHTIPAKHAATGKPILVTVNVKPDAVGLIHACRQYFASLFENYRPMADKNHERKEATFWAGAVKWVTGFRQTPTSDPKDGLVVECETWTKLGIDSILGRVLRCFSPELLLDYDAKRLRDIGGILQFEKGARGSAENPAEIIGHARESVGSLTNDPAFFNIPPIWAERSSASVPLAAVTETTGVQPPPTQQGVATMSDEKQITAVDAAVVSAIQAENTSLKESATTVKEENKKLRDQIEAQRIAVIRANAATAIQAAVARGAIAPAMKVKSTDKDGKEIEVPYKDYLVAQCEVNPGTILVIEQMAGKAGAAALTQRTVQQDSRDTAAIGAADASGLVLCESASVEDATRGYCVVQAEARRAAAAGAVHQIVDDLRRQAGRIYEKHLRKPFLELGHLPIRDEWLGGIDMGTNVQAANALGTLAATNIVAQESLVLLKKRLMPFLKMSFDLSSKSAVFNQAVLTRTRAVSVVNHRVVTDTTYTDSDFAAYDVTVTLDTWPYVQNTILGGSIAATTRDLKRELMDPLFYALAKDIFETWTGIMTVANFSKVATLNRTGFTIGAAPDRTTLIGIDNDADTLLWPEEGRIALFDTASYNYLRRDPSLVSYWQAGPESTARSSGDLGERENLMPYKTQSFNARADGVKGFAQNASATAVVTRIPTTPETAFGLSYPGVRNVITEPDIGLSVLLTIWQQPDGSAASVRGEALVGAAAAQTLAGECLL
jgi:hypothetical protein